MSNSELAAIIFGLASAASWGAGDFSGGLASKSGSVLGVLLFGYAVSTVLLGGCALWLGSTVPSAYSLAAGILAGITGLIGLAVLYRGLANGPMGIVAPLAAVTTAALPVFLGLFLEGIPSGLQIEGFLAAFAAIWLLTTSQTAGKFKLDHIRLPVTAGFFLGLTLILIDQAAEQNVLEALLVTRVTGIFILIILLLIFGKGRLPPRSSYPIICLAGIFDTGGYTFYALAVHTGRLDTSAVLAALYPGATVMLAWLLLKERITARQWLGIFSSLLAIALIAV